MIVCRSKPKKNSEFIAPYVIENQDASEESLADKSKIILCAFCSHEISSVDQIISVNGSHRHIFANPNGIVFDIGCFGDCGGCIADPVSYLEFTWFNGYSWRVAGCGRCMHHLGWLFSSDKMFKNITGRDSLPGSFYGLIMDNIIVPGT